MSPETQDMNILLNNERHPGGAQDAPEQMMPEFDDFFEKLSHIDDLTLTGNQAPERKTGAITQKPIRLRPDKAPNVGIQPGQKRRMQVMRSDFIQNSSKGKSRRSSAAGSRWRGGAPIPGGVLTFFKLATAAALLFGIGLGSGYLALSLPFKPDEGFPLVRDDRRGGEAIVAGEVADRANPGMVTAPDVPAFSKKMEATGGNAGGNTAVMRNGSDDKVRSASKTGKAAVQKPAQKVQIVQSKDRGRYAIQVGACNSPACVSAYRKLLLAHVSSDAIQVIERNVGKSKAKVQRIRVVSLSAFDATKLKDDLTASDARFKDAYVITLSKSPSS